MFDQDGDVIMLRVKPFTIITGGAHGVDLKAEALARQYDLDVQVLVPPCHPRSATLRPLTYAQLNEASPWKRQAELTLKKRVTDPISIQYIHRNYCVVQEADMVLAFTLFQPTRAVFGLRVNKVCTGGSGWAVEFAKMLRKTLYVHELELNFWFWFNHDDSAFEMCDDMSEKQIVLPTFMPKTAIVGVRNLSDFLDGVDELEATFQRSVLL